MPKRKRKTEMEEVTNIVMGFANLVDALFVKYTGKTVGAHLKEFSQRPQELPRGEEISLLAGEDMSLTDAYAVMGLPKTASFEQVKKNYRALANIFHPDRGGYTEAMVLLNKAYARIEKEKGK